MFVESLPLSTTRPPLRRDYADPGPGAAADRTILESGHASIAPRDKISREGKPIAPICRVVGYCIVNLYLHSS